MKRIKLVVAYDGTAYSGWQIQTDARTIEGELKAALEDLLGEEVRLIGASRTDAGVHSLGNVVVFDTKTRIPPEKIAYALNVSLPRDITVQESREVDADWHPRRCNSVKTYEYRILNRKIPLPTRRLDTYFYYYDLNVERMRKAALKFMGNHDFKSFCGSSAEEGNTVRTIFSCQVYKEGDIITIRVSGSGFLYHMVRIMAGTLIQVGQEQMDPDDVSWILEAKNRGAAGPTAPPQGLTMIGIEF